MSELKSDLSRWPLIRPLDDAIDASGIVLNRNVCVVGRDRVHLPLPSIQVSRAHALVVNDGHSIYVRDLASKNGVYRNGEPVRESELLHSDVLGIGHLRFRCESGFENSEPEADEPSPAELRIEGSSIGLPVTQRTFLIGTRDGCDAVIKGTAISPVHAVIFRRGAKNFVRDLSSEFGTFVNGRRTREIELSPGDEIRVGTIILCYQYAASATQNGDAIGQFNFAEDSDVGDAPTIGMKEESFGGRVAVASLSDDDEATELRAPSHVTDDEDLTIRVWDLLEPEEHAERPANPEGPSKELPGYHSWSERSDEEAGVAEATPEPNDMGRQNSPEDSGGSNGVNENSKELGPERRRAEELRIDHILGRLTRNVRGLKSAWKTLHEPHARSGERESARRPD